MFSCTQTGVIDEIPESLDTQVEVLSIDLTKAEFISVAVKKKGTYSISESEAQEKLLRYSSSNSNSGTSLRSSTSERNFSTPQIKSTNLKKSSTTGKDLYYEIVFENDRGTGFSLVSADERVPEVLCYSEVGSLSDTLFNKSLKFCIDMVDFYVEEQIKEELDIDALLSSVTKKMSSVSNSETSALRAGPLDTI